MSGASHTPGPWQVADTHPHWPKRCVVDCDGQTKPFTLIAEATEANARLIAAAPDYADAAPDAADFLEQYADFIRRDVKAADLERHPYLPEIERVAADLRAAIAKARGQ